MALYKYLLLITKLPVAPLDWCKICTIGCNSKSKIHSQDLYRTTVSADEALIKPTELHTALWNSICCYRIPRCHGMTTGHPEITVLVTVYLTCAHCTAKVRMLSLQIWQDAAK